MPLNPQHPTLPETGYLRLPQLIGQKEVTAQEASANKALAKEIAANHPASKPGATAQDKRDLAQRLARVGARTPQPAIRALFPISKSTLWKMVQESRFPKPVKLGPRITVWRAEDIRKHLASTEA